MWDIELRQKMAISERFLPFNLTQQESLSCCVCVINVLRGGLGCASPSPLRTLTELTVTFVYSSMAPK